MKKSFSCFVAVCFFATSVFAQNMDFSDEAFFPTEDVTEESADDFSDSGSSDDEFFGYSDEDYFGSSDDDFFEDDGIEELKTLDEKSSALAKGTLFEIGSVRVGGSISTSISTFTNLYRDDDKNFGDRLADTRLKPGADASLFVDARPTSTLRLYTKFGISYPYTDSVSVSSSSTTVRPDDNSEPLS